VDVCVLLEVSYKFDSVACRGRTPDWYNSVYGHLVANYARRIRQSFDQDISVSDVPETNV